MQTYKNSRLNSISRKQPKQNIKGEITDSFLLTVIKNLINNKTLKQQLLSVDHFFIYVLKSMFLRNNVP